MKNKFILGEKQYIGKINEDNFIDIDLHRTIDTIKKDSVNNVFDFQTQYNKERNSSLKFCIYGIVESRYANCDNIALNIKVADSDNENNVIPTSSPYIYSSHTSSIFHTVLTKPLSGNNSALTKNLYGASKGSYFLLFEIDKNNLSGAKNKSIYIETFDVINNVFGKFSIPILYYDDLNELVDFGTENADINDDDEIIEINNDFPFFYDRHWVKLNIEPDGPSKVYFTSPSKLINESNPTATIELTLDEPSKFGLERATVQINYATDIYGRNLTTSSFGDDFIFVEPILSWNIGEQTKSFDVTILNDFFVESEIETVTFRIIPLRNCRAEASDQYEFTLFIESEDQPVVANFNTTNTTIYQSSGNTIQTYSVNINLSSPVTVNNQGIKINILPSSTALLGEDYYLNAQNPLIDYAYVYFPISSYTGNFTFYIKSNSLYDIDKSINFTMERISPNIIPGNNINFTLKDSLTKLFTQYIIPKNDSLKTSVYKMVYNGVNVLQNSVIQMEETNTSSGVTYSQPNRYLTNKFKFDLKIKNLGNRIIWDNNYVNTNEFITIPIDLSATTSDIKINLPSNELYDTNLNGYRYTKYEFTIDNVSKFYPANTPATANSTVDQNNYFTKVVLSDRFSASTVGMIKAYMVTRLNDYVYTGYDEVNHKCLSGATYLSTGVTYNGLILAPLTVSNQNNQYQITKTIVGFRTSRVRHFCPSPDRTILPLGNSFVPLGPFVKTASVVKLGQLFIQAAHMPNHNNEKMILGAYDSGTNINSYKCFRTWNNTNYSTKTSVQLQITNLGDIDVDIAGQSLAPGTSWSYDYTDFNFDDLNIELPGNAFYDSTFNMFIRSYYGIKIKNISIYDDSGQLNKVIDIDLGTTYINANVSSSLPVHYIQMKIKNVLIEQYCGQNPLTPSTNLLPARVMINDIVAFNEMDNPLTSSVVSEVSYVNYTTTPRCAGNMFNYQIY